MNQAHCRNRNHSGTPTSRHLSPSGPSGLMTGARVRGIAPRAGSLGERTSCEAQHQDHVVAAPAAPHLALLRDVLAQGGQDDPSVHVPPRRRSPERAALEGELTLAEWVSRTQRVGR
ncbi:hypothetical protein [Streptomyces sp. 142MFCol3.1]|uniref:hypothetical protein n=1 Tax=Streptomyces sp. 142MFCol3.1 TaxID=1172179 RepID=UPI000405110A|nr:hypothetical protein [Streptomyces sp. 142MFCol3.1]